MRKIPLLLLAAALCLALPACHSSSDEATKQRLEASTPELVQAGRFDSFAAGDFKGHVELERLAKGAWTGLGTFEGVDGELIILDGTIYKVSSDGKVSLQEGKLKTPFAMSAKGTPDQSIYIAAGLTPAKLAKGLDNAFGAKDEFLAVRIEARFSKLKLRSPPPAKEPYPDLAGVIAKQQVFELENVSGMAIDTLSLILTPPSAKPPQAASGSFPGESAGH